MGPPPDNAMKGNRLSFLSLAKGGKENEVLATVAKRKETGRKIEAVQADFFATPV
jgi:hypothetical protein